MQDDPGPRQVGRLNPGWKETTSFREWGPRYYINVVRFGLKLKNLDDLDDAFSAAADVLLPATDQGQHAFPSRYKVARDMVKLDCLSMLLQRLKEQACENQVWRCLTPDSSPQHGWEFFNCIEDRYERSAGWDPRVNPLGGFTWLRRSMPAMTMGTDKSAARKATLLLHSAVLENGSGAADVMKWRTSVRGFCSDQGRSTPYPRSQ